MQAFYARLNEFLVNTGLEKSTEGLGCSAEEIAEAERAYGVQFPLAYRLFLRWCGRGPMSWMDQQDLQLDSLPYSWESARALLAAEQEALEPGGFVFSQWQGYNFLYFLLGADNPPVKLCIIKYYVPGLEYEDYGRFTDWLIQRIKSSVELRSFLRKTSVRVPAVWAELDRIARLADA